MANDIQLKDYQLFGLNWMNLLHGQGFSGILADDMGLGKTCQVISFIAHARVLHATIAGPSLDIERGESLSSDLLKSRLTFVDPAAFNKLEKVALRYTRRTGRPLVLILNNIHFFNNDDDGKHMLLQMQQRAESWAAAGMSDLVSRRRGLCCFRNCHDGVQQVFIPLVFCHSRC